MPPTSPAPLPPLSAWKATLFVAGAALCFHASYLLPHGGALIFGYVACLTVVVPTGKIVFKQGKSVPIQFFADGLPAPDQQVWDSPWGRLGFCICYDLSYRRVTDQLVRLGAQALIVLAMDVERWGRREHELHRRVAPVRAAEYGVPIFRVASSGISQAVDPTGAETARAPLLGEGMTLYTKLLPMHTSVPLDAWLGPASVFVTAGWMVWLVIGAW